MSHMSHICLTLWLRSVTLIKSLLVIKDIFSHTLVSNFIWNEMCLIGYSEYKDQEGDTKNGNKICYEEPCFFYYFKKRVFIWN